VPRQRVQHLDLQGGASAVGGGERRRGGRQTLGENERARGALEQKQGAGGDGR
jgi:hypothetical protein